MDNRDPSQPVDLNESLVAFQTNQGLELRGVLLRLSRYQAVFEIYLANAVLRVSEVLQDFKIFVNSQLWYAGKAVTTNLVNSGTTLVCEVRLDDVWLDLNQSSAGLSRDGLDAEYEGFFRQWQTHFKVRPEFRLFVSELRSFFHDLHLWLQHVELRVRSRPSADNQRMEHEVAQQVAERSMPAFKDYVERFEELCSRLTPEEVPAHQVYIRREMHPLLLCSPFVYRTFAKPLGYAGDYEVVNMIMRDPLEGASLFAKIVNYFFLNQAVGVAHRNRIRHLVEQLVQEGLRTTRAGGSLRALSVGCGPAAEVQQFMAQGSLAAKASFELLDFNDETLQHARQAVLAASQRHGVTSPALRLTKKSVHQIVKEASRATAGRSAGLYDYIYCAGLFDYLTDQVCRRLMSAMYDWLAPGGLLIATNVAPNNPLRHGMEYLLDWQLVYRNADQLLSLKPERAHPDLSAISDLTGVNVWVEVRKSDHG